MDLSVVCSYGEFEEFLAGPKYRPAAALRMLKHELAKSPLPTNGSDHSRNVSPWTHLPKSPTSSGTGNLKSREKLAVGWDDGESKPAFESSLHSLTSLVEYAGKEKLDASITISDSDRKVHVCVDSAVDTWMLIAFLFPGARQSARSTAC